MVKMEAPSLCIQEEDVIKLILEFLSTKHYHVAMRTLEKESGVVNCNYSDEVLFLRELVMDGDFNEVMQFGNSFTGNQAFDRKRFNFIVLQQKYIELIYTKSHIIGKQNYNIIEDVMKTLAELKPYCASKDDYSNFCWMLTVPNLNSLEQFRNWNIDLSRLKTFEELLNCLSSFMPLVKKKMSSRHISANDRLLHLLVKGLFYESCIEYCQSIGRCDSGGFSNDFFPKDLLKHRFDDYSSNLLSWMISLPHEAFTTPFQKMDVDFRLIRLGRKNNITHSVDIPSSSRNKSHTTEYNALLTNKKEFHNEMSNSDQTFELMNGKIENVNNMYDLKEQKNVNSAENHVEPARNSINYHSDATFSIEDIKISSSLKKVQIGKEIHSHSNSVVAMDKQLSSSSVDSSILRDGGKVVDIQKDQIKLDNSVQCTGPDDPSSPSQPKFSYFIPLASQCNEGKPSSPQPITAVAPTSADLNIENSSTSMALRKSLDDANTRNYHRKKSDLIPVTASLMGREIHKEIKKAASSPRKSKSHALEDNIGQNKNHPMTTSTPKSNPMDRVSFPPLSPVTNRKLDMGNKKVVHDEKASIKVKDCGDIKHAVHKDIPEADFKEDIPIVSDNSNDKENALSQSGVNLGPVINGVRRPISNKMMTQLALPQQQVNDQPPEVTENVLTQPPVLKGNGPKIKMKDGSKVHLKELMKSKESNEIPNTTKTADVKVHEEENRMKYDAISILEDTQAVRTVSFHPDGNIYAIGANSKVLRICDMVVSGDNVDSASLPPMTVLFKRTKYHRGSIYCMDWSPDGRLLATGSNDKSIKILQFDPIQYTQTGEDIDLNFHNGTVRELAFVPNQAALLVSGGTGDGIINITDTVTQKIVGTLNGHSGNVMSVFAGLDLIATGGTDNAVRLWDLRSRRCVDVVIVGESCPASVALSDCVKYLASGQEDGSILVYDLIAGRTLENGRVHQSDCRSVRFSNDSNHLLTSSYDGNIAVTHLSKKIDSSPTYYYVAQHSDKVIQCRWHPTENLFLSSSADRTAMIWKHVS